MEEDGKARFERMKGQFIDVCKKYGFYQQIENNRGLYFSFMFKLGKAANRESYEKHPTSPDRLELAKLLRFLWKCKDSEIKLNGTIRKDDNVQIRNGGTIFYLMMCINKALSDASEGFYEDKFDWDYKKHLTIKVFDPDKNVELIEEDNFFVESYTKEELDKIIEYEERELEKKKMANNAKLGKELYFIKYKMFEAGIFTGIKFRDYSFLYDFFAILGRDENFNPDNLKEDSGDVRREKYQKIRPCLDAYDKDQKRKTGDNWEEIFDKRMKEHRKLQNLLKRSKGE